MYGSSWGNWAAWFDTWPTKVARRAKRGTLDSLRRLVQWAKGSSQINLWSLRKIDLWYVCVCVFNWACIGGLYSEFLEFKDMFGSQKLVGKLETNIGTSFYVQSWQYKARNVVRLFLTFLTAEEAFRIGLMVIGRHGWC